MTKNKNDRTQAHKDFDVEIGKWLRKTRLAESYTNPITGRKIVTTQTKLAKKLGVTFQQVQKYEKGLNVIGLFKFKEICVFFNKCPKDVFETIDVEVWKKDEEPLILTKEVQPNV